LAPDIIVDERSHRDNAALAARRLKMTHTVANVLRLPTIDRFWPRRFVVRPFCLRTFVFDIRLSLLDKTLPLLRRSVVTSFNGWITSRRLNTGNGLLQVLALLSGPLGDLHVRPGTSQSAFFEREIRRAIYRRTTRQSRHRSLFRPGKISSRIVHTTTARSLGNH
jgi:hypothetical protein